MKNLILMLTAALMSVSPKASAVESGTWDNGVSWQIRDSVFTVSGNGAMPSCGYSNVVRDENGNVVSLTTTAPYDAYKAGIKSVVVGQGITAIGENAFLFCKNLTSVYLPASVASIGQLAFASNYSLSAITSLNPNPPACSESRTFTETDLSRVTLTVPSGRSGTYGQTAPWSGIPNIVEEDPGEDPGEDPAGELQGSCGNGVSWKIQGSVLTVSGSGAMDDYSYEEDYDFGAGMVIDITAPWNAYKAGIQSVVVGQGVAHIGNCAFMFFENLTSVYLSGSVTSIGEHALAVNYSLSAITSLNPTPPACQNNTFNDTPLSRVTLTVPEGSADTYSDAFAWGGMNVAVEEPAGEDPAGELQEGECGDGVSWKIRGSVLTVSGSGAMYSYTYSREYGDNGVLLGITTTAPWDALKAGIESVVVGQGVTAVGNCAFMNFENLTSVSLPESVDAIGENALAANSSLSAVTSLNPNPPSCHDGTLANIDLSRVTLFVPYGRSGIYSQTAPWSGMQVVERDEFACGSGVFWEVRDSVLTIGGNGAMDSYSYEEFYEWGIGMSKRTTAPYSAHQAAIKSVVVGPGVTHIGTCAFMDFENLTSVSLSGSVGSIGQGALAMNGSLSAITSFALNPPSCDGTAFEQTDLGGITLTVSYGRSGIYRQTSPWSGIANIVEGGAEKIALSGQYGSNHTWVLDTVRGVATVSGKGRLPDNGNPLRSLRAYIKTVILNEGTTAIPAKAFESFGSLEKVFFPFDCDILGAAAFGSCTALKTLVFKGVPLSMQTADGSNIPTFNNVDIANVTVYVHPEMLAWFQGIPKWQAFKEILPFEALPESHDASLKYLTVTGFLTPLYSPDISDYTVILSDTVNYITITAAANHPSATVAGTGYKSLNAEENSFEIAVTAENRATVKTYTIRVERVSGARDASLKSFTVTPGILSPSFSPDLRYYRLIVPDDTREISVELETADSASVLDESPGYSLPGLKTLSPLLPNVYDFLVITEDRQSYMFYRLTVVRESDSGITGISGISGGEIKVYLENKNLSLISPVAENVNIYTVTGKLLHSLKKQSGKATAVMNCPERILIVKGSSGWSRKVISGIRE